MKKKFNFIKIFKPIVLFFILVISFTSCLSNAFVSYASTNNTTLKLLSVHFKTDDYHYTYGVIGQDYPVELWQDGNENNHILVSLTYCFENENMFLSVPENSILTFDYDYNPMREWKFVFKGREYTAENVKLMLTYIPDDLQGNPAKTPEQIIDLPPVTVCDWDGNPLYYTDDGFLFNDKAQVYYDDINDTSNLLRVVKDTKNNSDVLSSEDSERFVSLSVSSRTVRPLVDVEIDGVTYQIINGNGEPLSIDHEAKRIIEPDYEISSISINDDLYALSPKAGGAPILAKLVVEPDGEHWFTNGLQICWEALKRVFTPWQWGNELQHAGKEVCYVQKFYDLWGHEIDRDMYVDLGLKRWEMKPVTTVGNYLDVMLENGQPFIIDNVAETVGGEQLHDNLGSPISVLYGQLIDVAGYPLYAYVKDEKTDKLVPRPCFENNGLYYDYNGDELDVLEIDGILRLCKDGEPLYSVISDLKRGEHLYFVYLDDGVTMIPSIIDIDPDGDTYYKDIDGNDISKIIVFPKISLSDYYNNNPNEKIKSSPFDNFMYWLSLFSAIAIVVFGVIILIFVVKNIVKLIKG